MRILLCRLAAALFIGMSALILYRWVLFPVGDLARYPWGSDTWGHLIKVQFLGQEVAQGNLYPNLFPDWYAGVQLFRYYAPLPYYALLAVQLAVPDPFQAGNWFLFLCALLGGLSFLLYQRWIGLLPATLGGVLFTAIPDNARVAFAEGNLPRTLAAALLPATFYCLLRVMDSGRHRIVYALPLALLVSLVILSHAMMGAIFLASLTLFALVYWLLGGSSSAGLLRGGLGLGTGLLLSGWWLLPSLTGGITELNQSAMTEALAAFPLTASFNPIPRLANREAFYIGLGLGLGVLLLLASWHRLGPLPRALLLAGTATTLVTTDFLNPLFNSLPLHHLFWPIRFTSFTGFALLLSLVASSKALWSFGRNWQRVALLGVLLVSLWDLWASSSLIFLRPADGAVVAAAERLRQMPGWRVATADLSLLGSAPSYWLTLLGKREQLYGWGYQGARTASNVAALNYAMEHRYLDYAVDRLDELGVDDLLLLERAMAASGLDRRLEEAGFRATRMDDRLTLYHRDGVPRAFRVSYDLLGIGGGAQDLALLFPRVVLGGSPRVDDYDLGYLRRFKTLFLSRFSWKDRSRAEQLIAEYARAGGRVVVDLTGSPPDVFSVGPKFMSVYGEPIQPPGPVDLRDEGKRLSLRPFSREEGPWQTHTLQGLNRELITFDYYGQQGTALGYKDLGGGRVWFVGLNLPFHAMLTRDPVATQLLEDVLGVRAAEVAEREIVPLQGYRADEGGYSFSYDLDRPGEILLPVAAHEGAAVLLDGRRVPSTSLDNLVTLYSPAGRHEARVIFEKTGIYSLGATTTGFAAIVLLVCLAGFPRPAPKTRRSVHGTEVAQAG